jgi:hypothetical protein
MTNTCLDSYARSGFALDGRWLACSCSGNPFGVRGEERRRLTSTSSEFGNFCQKQLENPRFHANIGGRKSKIHTLSVESRRLVLWSFGLMADLPSGLSLRVEDNRPKTRPVVRPSGRMSRGGGFWLRWTSPLDGTNWLQWTSRNVGRSHSARPARQEVKWRRAHCYFYVVIHSRRTASLLSRSISSRTASKRA